MSNEKKIELIRYLGEIGYTIESIADEDDFGGNPEFEKIHKQSNRVSITIYNSSIK